MNSIQTHILTGFDDPRLGQDEWMRLLAQGDTDVLSLTWPWCRSWWETLGTGKLLLVAAERDGRIFAIAPLFALEGMIFFAGTGVSDYLDFIGNIESAETLTAMLAVARGQVPDFVGFRFWHVPQRSRTASLLQAAAPQLGLLCHFEIEIAAVEVDLVQHRETVMDTINRSMRRREERLRRDGTLVIRQETDLAAIRKLLGDFYALHVARWEGTEEVSQFATAGQRAFLERFMESVEHLGWTRFLWLEWNGQFLGAEVDWYYRGVHFSGPWCFAMEHSKYSPGQVLLRQSVVVAYDAGLHTFDLGTGDQAYKRRLPARMKTCETWGLYPP
jgi:CelD/BcsL family acetyltransferase involved in cellulose biosynthesis